MIGERSMPPMTVKGIHLLRVAKTGSVRFRKMRTIGLKGSGLTQDNMAEIITIQKYRLRRVFSNMAIA
jgi:hypothetical protein